MEAGIQQTVNITSRGFMNPAAVIDSARLLSGQRVADFGSGHGYFVLEMAKRVGAAGRVYAVDVRPEALEAMYNWATLQGFQNVEPVLTNLELPGSTGLRDTSLDFVLISNLMHQVRDQEAVVGEAQRILKDKGVLMIIGWIPHTKLAPSGNHLSPDQANDIAVSAGFDYASSFDCGAYHWGLIFNKRPRGY